MVKRFKLAEGIFGDPWQVGKWLFLDHRGHPSLAVVELDQDPPRQRVWKLPAVDAQPAPEGGWVVISRLGEEEHAWTAPGEDPVSATPGTPGPACRRLARVGSEVLGMAELITHRNESLPLLRLAGGPPGPVPGVRPSKGVGTTSDPDARFHAIGSVTLGDGSDVLFWDGDAWERGADGQWRPTFVLGARAELRADLVPWGKDGFYYLDERLLFRARRGGSPERVFPWAENIMRIAPGPEGSLLLQFGKNDRSICVAVAFPDDGSVIPLKRKDLESPHVNELFSGFFWAEETGLLYTVGWHLIALPAAEILKRKRARYRS